ncbi:hypothetical protein Cfla_1217 [Cellulomonas flavigena DSM 20109]|uniref:Uncharacterized protein n=1 Tax=Cellulomonas flavigena (strain ATCC 482 / DSM 20109 / BCRC 11376 / JCM 18109 / NBRC 3775 / NCIMB 8073 / NRS 134) TaxID=446466 RepID=D5UBM4_CELFN|nr:hypothetical protein [Cellulomonas flavigena]ADG74119.1 hypothetical protein Cfla_1217 [Cellulomonas flavigena DSM 20109]
MDIFWLILTLLALSAWLGRLAHVVREDGLGHREPPRSHPDDTPSTRVRSR